MGSILDLIVPEQDQEEAVIRAYYEYVLKKKQTIRPDLGCDQVEDFVGYQQATRRLEEGELFFVYETLSNRIFSAIDGPAFRAVFDLEGGYDNPVIDDPADIETLIDILRDAKAELIENPPADADWELSLETQSIALCEFALKHGYGIELSW